MPQFSASLAIIQIVLQIWCWRAIYSIEKRKSAMHTHMHALLRKHTCTHIFSPHTHTLTHHSLTHALV